MISIINSLIRFSVIGMSIAFTACTPKPETFIPQIQKQAQEFLDARNSMDEKKLELMLYRGNLDPGGVPEYLKGRSDFIALIRNKYLALRSEKVGVPQIPQVANGYYVSFVPVTTVIVPDNRGDIGKTLLFAPSSRSSISYIVAVSTDKGKTWRFFQANDSRKSLDKALPKVASKLVLPGDF